MKFFNKYKKTKIILGIIIVAIVVFFLFRGEKELVLETQIAEIGSIKNIVSEKGKVQAAENVTLSFARSGRINSVNFKEGDKILRGQTIATLELGSLSAQLQQAEAALERILNERTIDRAETSFLGTKQNLANLLRDLYIIADDAIRNKSDQAFVADGSDSPKIINGGNNYFDRQDINNERRDLRYLLIDWEKEVRDINIDSNFDLYIQSAKDKLLILRNYLTNLSTLVNTFQTSDGQLTATEVSTYQAAVSSARTIINNAISSLDSAVNLYNSEKIAFEQQNNSQGENVALRNIRIREAEAQISAIRSQINDAIIVSPISGTVTRVFYNLGESISATVPMVSVISDSNYEITVNIPEDNISNVEIGDIAEVTFDAYRDATFEAEVVYVAPNAELIEGVAVFKVTLEFKYPDERIRTGLSANIDIVVEQKDGVISVPTRAVIYEPAGQFVRVLDKSSENSYIKIPVKLGLRGEGRTVEITEGLNEGDEVITLIDDANLKRLNQK